MDASPALITEIIRFWQSRGMVPCAEAQADGVPCPTLGRDCATCAHAIRALEEAREPHVPPQPEAQP